MPESVPIDTIPIGSKEWEAVVSVQEKLQETQSLSSPSKYRKFVFADEKVLSFLESCLNLLPPQLWSKNGCK